MFNEKSHHKRLHTIWLHSFEAQEALKLISDDTIQNSGYLREGGRWL